MAAKQPREWFGNAYPFTCRRFQTDGRSIFATVLDATGEEALLDMACRQYAFRQVISPSLYDGSENAHRWYPLKGNKVVVLDPDRNFGKPLLAHSGMDTRAIADAFEAEEKDLRRVALLFGVSLEEKWTQCWRRGWRRGRWQCW